MSKKGFTLIELLAIIVLLGIIMLVVGTNVFGILGNQKDKLYDEQIKGLEDSAITFTLHELKNGFATNCSSTNSFTPTNSNCGSTAKNVVKVSSDGYARPGNAACCYKIAVSFIKSAGYFDDTSGICNNESGDYVYVYKDSKGVHASLADGSCPK